MIRSSVLLAGLLLLPTVGTAQEVDETGSVLARYEAQKKDTGRAMLLEAIMPMTGYAYAEKPGRGILPFATGIAGALLVTAGVFCELACTDAGWADTAIYGGLALAGASRIWGMLGVRGVVRDHNTALLDRLRAEGSPVALRGPGGMRLLIGVAVPAR